MLSDPDKKFIQDKYYVFQIWIKILTYYKKPEAYSLGVLFSLRLKNIILRSLPIPIQRSNVSRNNWRLTTSSMAKLLRE
jgi:hypothetical protein